MRKIIYYVATSLDGYIAGKNDDISMFEMEGEFVDQYSYDLESFDTVIMGRNTYEFGYQFGMKPGDAAYPNMDHYVFSNGLPAEKLGEKVEVVPLEIERVKQLKNDIGSDIYLCGGGMFAGWLMKNGLIDEIRLKINPIILGDGIRLFGNYTISSKLKVLHNQSYADGHQIVSYQAVNS
ncbi:dihydrofolate reductase family protein [Ekhidna sp.]